MGNFENKIKRMKTRLLFLQSKYGDNHIKVRLLVNKIDLYEKVAKMSHKELGEQLSYAAGEIAKLKTGYYNYATSVDKEKKLLNVLKERIMSDNEDLIEKRNNAKEGSLVEIGCSVDDIAGGFEC